MERRSTWTTRPIARSWPSISTLTATLRTSGCFSLGSTARRTACAWRPNGNVYIATGPVVVYSPQGKLIRTIQLPELAANLEFGGPDLKTLFITARTSVYRVRVDDQGWTIH